jgi:hypothetical protein
MKKKVRPTGDIMLDMEKLLLEMAIDHDMQWYEILNLVHGYLQVHCPNSQETYTKDGSHPVFYYGPKEGLK